MDYSIRALTEMQSNLKLINTVFALGNVQKPNGDFVCEHATDTQWDPYANLAQAEDMAFRTGATIRLRKTTGAYIVVALGSANAVQETWQHHSPFVSISVHNPDGQVFDEAIAVRPAGSRCPEKVMAIMITVAFEQFAKELCAA